MLSNELLSHIQKLDFVSNYINTDVQDKPIKTHQLFLLDVNIFNNKELYSECFNQVPKYRQNKINSYMFDKDKNLSLGAWVLLQYSMECLGYSNFEKHIKFSENNKPYCQWQTISFPNFNISHSGHYALCSIGKNPIGCDIQKHDTIEKELIDFCMLPDELKSFRDADYSKWTPAAFYRLWTLKESIMKMLSLGLSLNPKSIQFTEINSHYHHYKFNIDTTTPIKQNLNKINFYEYDSPKNYSISVCTVNS